MKAWKIKWIKNFNLNGKYLNEIEENLKLKKGKNLNLNEKEEHLKKTWTWKQKMLNL